MIINTFLLANTVINSCLNVSVHRHHPDAVPLDADIKKIAKEELGYWSINSIQVVDDLRTGEVSSSWGSRFFGPCSNPVIAVHQGLSPDVRRFQILTELALGAGKYRLIEMIAQVASGILLGVVLFSGGGTAIVVGKVILYIKINQAVHEKMHAVFVRDAERWAIKKFTSKQIEEIKIVNAVSNKVLSERGLTQLDLIDELKDESIQFCQDLLRMQERVNELKREECRYAEFILSEKSEDQIKVAKGILRELKQLLLSLPESEKREGLLKQIKEMPESEIIAKIDQLGMLVQTLIIWNNLNLLANTMEHMGKKIEELNLTDMRSMSEFMLIQLRTIKPDLSNFDSSTLSYGLQVLINHGWSSEFQATNRKYIDLFKNTKDEPTGLDLPFTVRPASSLSNDFYKAREVYHKNVYKKNNARYQIISFLAAQMLMRNFFSNMNTFMYLLILSTVGRAVNPLITRAAYYSHDRAFVATTKEQRPVLVDPTIWQGAL